jgi:hypothetical protein
MPTQYPASVMKNLLAEGQAAYFLGIVIGQFFVLYACKVRNSAPVGAMLFK